MTTSHIFFRSARKYICVVPLFLLDNVTYRLLLANSEYMYLYIFKSLNIRQQFKIFIKYEMFFGPLVGDHICYLHFPKKLRSKKFS